MSGICSAHRHHEAGCKLCESGPGPTVFVPYERKLIVNDEQMRVLKESGVFSVEEIDRIFETGSRVPARVGLVIDGQPVCSASYIIGPKTTDVGICMKDPGHAGAHDNTTRRC